MFTKSATIRSISNIAAYPISPNTPAVPKFANIRSISNLNALGYIPGVCECPDWLYADQTTCNWEVSDNEICELVTNGVSQYDVPFTLPVFRMHLLAESLSLASVVTGLYQVDEQQCVSYLVNPSLVTTYNKEASLVKTFTRGGCS